MCACKVTAASIGARHSTGARCGQWSSAAARRAWHTTGHPACTADSAGREAGPRVRLRSIMSKIKFCKGVREALPGDAARRRRRENALCRSCLARRPGRCSGFGWRVWRPGVLEPEKAPGLEGRVWPLYVRGAGRSVLCAGWGTRRMELARNTGKPGEGSNRFFRLGSQVSTAAGMQFLDGPGSCWGEPTRQEGQKAGQGCCGALAVS